MSETDLYSQALAAADPSDINYWKSEIDGRWSAWLVEFDRYTGRLVEGKALLDTETGHHAVNTVVGVVTMRLVYGVDEGHLGGWVVFLDGPPSLTRENRKELAWLHLSSRGWVNLKGEPYADRFGRLSVEAVAKAVVAGKLAFIASQINQAAKR